MKKTAVLLVIVIMALWLSACNNRSNPTFKESDMVKHSQNFLLNQLLSELS